MWQPSCDAALLHVALAAPTESETEPIGTEQEANSEPQPPSLLEMYQETGRAPPRVRRTALEVAVMKVKELEDKHQKATADLRFKEAKTGYASSDASRKLAVDKASEKIQSIEQEIGRAKDRVQECQASEELKQQAAAIKAAKQASDAESKKHISDGAQCAVVQLKIDQDSRFDGRKEKNEKVWKDVHDNYLKLIEVHDLPESDTLNLEGLQARYSKEIAHFRWYAKEVDRYKQSGASADDIEKIQKRCAMPCLMREMPSTRPGALMPHTLCHCTLLPNPHPWWLSDISPSPPGVHRQSVHGDP
jgi:hypothetical protein